MGFWKKLFGNIFSGGAGLSEEQLHKDAYRFARLLVEEIKLYHTVEIYEGRRNADLYQRLKKQIDRNRKIYEKRVSPVIAAKSNYFYEELVKTLAGGDASKLGPGWEGPEQK